MSKHKSVQRHDGSVAVQERPRAAVAVNGQHHARPAASPQPAGGSSRLRMVLEQAFSLDIRSLATFRIVIALSLILSLIYDLPDLKAFWTDDGILPRAAQLDLWRNPWMISLHLGNGSIPLIAIFVIIQIIAAHGLLLGYRTRLMTIVSWLLLTSLQTRNPVILQGGDDIQRLFLFWGIFLPWGACWSLDARDSGARPLRTRVFTGGGAGFLVQVGLIYIFSAAFKSQGAAWGSDRTALYYALSLNQIATPIAHWLLNYPEVLRILTTTTVLLEGFGPLLFIVPVWNGPIRTAAIAAFIGMHLGIMLTLRIGFFPMICIAGLFGLLPSWFWDELAVRIARIRTIREPVVEAWEGFRDMIWDPATKRSRTAQPLPASERRLLQPGGVLNVVPLALAAYVTLWNLSTVNKQYFQIPEPAQTLAWVLRLDQHWNLFAPQPFREDGWYVIPGKLANGREIDVYRDGAPVSFAQPVDVADTFKTYRWWKYLNNLYFADFKDYRLYYGRYLCRQWNEHHSGADVLETFEILYMRQTVQPNNGPRETERISLWEHRCF